MSTIEVLYSCEKCGVVDAAVQVPTRTDDQDVVSWLNLVCVVALVRDHRQRSPKCAPKTFTMIKVPFDNRVNIGGPRIQ